MSATPGPSALKVQRFKSRDDSQLATDPNGELVLVTDLVARLRRMTVSKRLTTDTVNRIIDSLGLK